MLELHNRIRKITLKRKDDRQKAASFIREESKKIGNLFNRLSHATNPKVVVIDVLLYYTYAWLQYIQVLEQFAELLSSSVDTVPFIIGVCQHINTYDNYCRVCLHVILR